MSARKFSDVFQCTRSGWYLIDSKPWLKGYGTYCKGEPNLDRLISTLEGLGVTGETVGTDSMMNVLQYETVHRFEDGGLRLRGGNCW